MKLPKPYKFSGKGINISNIAVFGIRSVNDDKTISSSIADPSKTRIWFLVCVAGAIVRYTKIGTPTGWWLRARRESWRRNILTDGKVFYNVVYNPKNEFVASKCYTRANQMNRNNQRAIIKEIDEWLAGNTS